MAEEWQLSVSLGKERASATAWWDEEGGFAVRIDGGAEMSLRTGWTVGEPLMLADIDGRSVTVQVCMGCVMC